MLWIVAKTFKIVHEISVMELFFRLNELFESDTEIDELGLLVAFPQKIGASQASADNSVALHEPFLLQEHKLGVSFWAIPPLFEFALGLFRQEQLLVDSGPVSEMFRRKFDLIGFF